jgi:hypothetical protein
MHYLHHSTLLTSGLGLESIVGSDRAFLVVVVATAAAVMYIWQVLFIRQYDNV